MLPPIKHTRKDGELTVRMNLPGTGKTDSSEVIDLGQAGGFDDAAITIECDAMPKLADGKTAVLSLESSNDKETWEESKEATVTITGPNAGAVNQCYRMPFTMGRYVRLKAVMDASSGDNTASIATLAITL